jgi:hypothetical protein
VSPWSVLAFLFPPGALSALLVWIFRSRDFRFDSRRRHRVNRTDYSFIVSNALESPVYERLTLVLQIMSQSGRFVAEPVVLCGPQSSQLWSGFVANDFDPKAAVTEGKHAPPSEAPPTSRRMTAADAIQYVISVPSFRALTTWGVQCATNGLEGDLWMHVYLEGRRHTIVRGSVRPSPQPWQGWIVWACASSVGCLSYIVPRLVLLAFGAWDPIDTTLVVIIALLSTAGFVVLWERRRYPVLGYGGFDTPM